jgi:excisionase family DNA binding protein
VYYVVNKHDNTRYCTQDGEIGMATFTTKQISEALGLSEETIRRWIRSGELAAESLGKSYRVQEDQLKEFLTKKGVSYENSNLAKLALVGTATATLSAIPFVGTVLGATAIGATALSFLNRKEKEDGNDISENTSMALSQLPDQDIDDYIKKLEAELEQIKKIKQAKDLEKQIEKLKNNI